MKHTYLVLFLLAGIHFNPCSCYSQAIEDHTPLSTLDETRQTATSSDKHILLIFSGSDWCKPCIRFKNEILESREFTVFADSNLVLLIADFPRKKQNMPAKEQIKQNELLAERFNPNGQFPKICLLDTSGTLLYSPVYKNQPPAQFVHDLRNNIESPEK